MRTSLRALHVAYIVLPFAVLVSLLVLVVPMAKDMRLRNTLGSSIEKQFGFSASTVWIVEKHFRGEMVVIKSVTAGGRFQRAGFQQGDLVISHPRIGQFYSAIAESRGEARFRVVRGGEGPPIAKRVARDIMLHLPDQE